MQALTEGQTEEVNIIVNTCGKYHIRQNFVEESDGFMC